LPHQPPLLKEISVTKPGRRLGRGLAALIGDIDANSPPAAGGHEQAPIPGVREIPVTSIAPNPTQPRTNFDPVKLAELAESIRSSGVIQPIVVRPHADIYQIVAGERRWRASQQAGLVTVPAIVRDVTDQQMLEHAIIENVQREDLNPIDRARAYSQCCTQFTLSAQQLAEDLGEDRTTVSNYIRLLDLPEPVQQLVRDGALSMGHARSLLGLVDPDRIQALAQQAVDDALSVRQLEALVRDQKANPPAEPPRQPKQPKVKQPLVQELEERFGHALGTRVSINEGKAKHTGRIVIEYYSIDDFDRIAERLGVPLTDL
jgi:ParB family transcriptional regulator, chromosome partitioning protein